MNIPKLFLATALIVISLSSCYNNRSNTNIEGLWISEKTSHFGDADKVALLIRKDSTKIIKACGLQADGKKYESTTKWFKEH